MKIYYDWKLKMLLKMHCQSFQPSILWFYNIRLNTITVQSVDKIFKKISAFLFVLSKYRLYTTTVQSVDKKNTGNSVVGTVMQFCPGGWGSTHSRYCLHEMSKTTPPSYPDVSQLYCNKKQAEKLKSRAIKDERWMLKVEGWRLKVEC